MIYSISLQCVYRTEFPLWVSYCMVVWIVQHCPKLCSVSTFQERPLIPKFMEISLRQPKHFYMCRQAVVLDFKLDWSACLLCSRYIQHSGRYQAETVGRTAATTEVSRIGLGGTADRVSTFHGACQDQTWTWRHLWHPKGKCCGWSTAQALLGG